MANSSRKSAGADKVTVEVRNLTRDPFPRVPLSSIAKEVFDAPYELSVVLLSPERAQKLNVGYRAMEYVPNVLSFPLSRHTGEIVLVPKEARRQYASGIVEGTYRDWIGLLVIHSMLHLKGFRHGRTMDARLRRILRRFGLTARLVSHGDHRHGTSHHHRH